MKQKLFKVNFLGLDMPQVYPVRTGSIFLLLFFFGVAIVIFYSFQNSLPFNWFYVSWAWLILATALYNALLLSGIFNDKNVVSLVTSALLAILFYYSLTVWFA